ncbi:MAG: hypothetical protein R6U96_04850 [Promethearchaeia archaeon]
MDNTQVHHITAGSTEGAFGDDVRLILWKQSSMNYESITIWGTG